MYVLMKYKLGKVVEWNRFYKTQIPYKSINSIHSLYEDNLINIIYFTARHALIHYNNLYS